MVWLSSLRVIFGAHSCPFVIKLHLCHAHVIIHHHFANYLVEVYHWVVNLASAIRLTSYLFVSIVKDEFDSCEVIVILSKLHACEQSWIQGLRCSLFCELVGHDVHELSWSTVWNSGFYRCRVQLVRPNALPDWNLEVIIENFFKYICFESHDVSDCPCLANSFISLFRRR